MALPRTLSRLKRLPKRIVGRAAAAPAASGRLRSLDALAVNPGNLHGFVYVPEGVQGPMPLVVVLHGCTQNAAGYDRGSGWSQLAERNGFALLFPEQARGNNPNLCFNWFQPQDTKRDSGEAASIHAMIAAMLARHPIDPARVFVTGLSAGGAMASAMLATYPETFAGGAIIAGIAHGCASGVPQAFECMGGRGDAIDGRTLGDRVRAASPHRGPWPRVSVWQGSADQTVAPSNAEAIVRQWRDVHGLAVDPTVSDSVGGYPHRVWAGSGGAPAVEHYSIIGMGHGTPLMPGAGDGQAGEAGAHMLDAGISSTDRIAAFFGIASPVAATGKAAPAPVRTASKEAAPTGAAASHSPTRANLHAGPRKVIEDALRAAGLMR